MAECCLLVCFSFIRQDIAMSAVPVSRIFGIPLEGVSLEAALAWVEREKQTWIVTANPEILLEAHRSPTYAETLKQADLRLVDGFGLWLMLRLFGVTTTRVTGVDLAEALMKRAAERSWRVGLVGFDAEASKRKWQATFPALVIHAEEGGTVSMEGTGDAANEEAAHRLTLFAPEVLLVAFGHPKQEAWILKHLLNVPTVKAAVGVGGTFNVWAGRVKRAPAWMRRMGIEWLWRVVRQPSRLGRIFRAVIVFPFRFLWSIVRGR